MTVRNTDLANTIGEMNDAMQTWQTKKDSIIDDLRVKQLELQERLEEVESTRVPPVAPRSRATRTSTSRPSSIGCGSPATPAPSRLWRTARPTWCARLVSPRWLPPLPALAATPFRNRLPARSSATS